FSTPLVVVSLRLLTTTTTRPSTRSLHDALPIYRRNNPVEGAYTTYLFREGIDKVLKKVGEETSEVIIGAKNNDKEEIKWEIADLIYHTLVLMNMTDVSIGDIKEVLYERHMEKQGDKQ